MAEKVLQATEILLPTHCFSFHNKHKHRLQKQSSPQTLSRNKSHKAYVQGKEGIRVRG
jgi:hypothetical protein